ncbi:MAG TPA: hypothetical protein PKD45_15500 [Flavobacteriales bacterium]|nr:hypothetical protein [Flavobacteriales bacterium]
MSNKEGKGKTPGGEARPDVGDRTGRAMVGSNEPPPKHRPQPAPGKQDKPKGK